jgi:hypothetical protein
VWLRNRWKSMIHPWEDFYRVQQFIQHYVYDYWESLKSPQKPNNFLFEDTSDIKYTLSGLEAHFNYTLNWNDFLCYELKIEKILNYNEWRKDPFTELTSPLAFASVINNQDFDKIFR